MSSKTLGFAVVCVMTIASAAFGQQPGMIVDPGSVLARAHVMHQNPAPHDITNGQAHARFGIFGIDSIPNFNGQFFASGFDANGIPNNHWYTNTVGNPPQMGGTTMIGAVIQPVNIVLEDANGNVFAVNGQPMIASAAPFVAPVLNSPVFSNAAYSSSDTPTQFNDAVQRAQFFNQMKPDWHTVLNPRVAQPLYLQLRQAPGCPTAPNFTGCNFVFALNSDGTCCSVILVNFDYFNSNLQQLAGFDIATGVMTTKDITTFLLPDTSLFFGDVDHCCFLGFHTAFFDPNSDPVKMWAVNYSSWISPEDFVGAFFKTADVTVLSHEIAETLNDPFLGSDGVHNITPWWLAPNGNCQDLLETGDVVEGLPNSLYPIFMNGFLYHPQNEALLQWFELKSPSDALGGAYSYPDTTVLSQPTPPQRASCAP